MNARGRFISFLLVVDAFFGGYALGLNSRQVEVVDPKLPPLQVKASKLDTKAEPVKKTVEKNSAKSAAKEKSKKDHKNNGAKSESKKRTSKPEQTESAVHESEKKGKSAAKSKKKKEEKSE